MGTFDTDSEQKHKTILRRSFWFSKSNRNSKNCIKYSTYIEKSTIQIIGKLYTYRLSLLIFCQQHLFMDLYFYLLIFVHTFYTQTSIYTFYIYFLFFVMLVFYTISIYTLYLNFYYSSYINNIKMPS